ncbi:M28 family peptidase [Chloroflexi bacterium TSY]|nr:M28 family peptidase [Chloroflexi bacterium TSY]
MNLNWHTLDRWIMGEAWTGSSIREHLIELCDHIGPRWSSSEAERRTVDYICHQLVAVGLENAALEEYILDTWKLEQHRALLVEEGLPIPILPFNRCPAFQLEAPLVDVGYGTPHNLEAVQERLIGAVAIMTLGFEPFTPPIPHAERLNRLAERGAAAAVVVDRKEGGRVEYHNPGDWRESAIQEHPLPTVAVSREIGARLRRAADSGKSLRLDVESRFYQAPSWNVAAELPGTRWSNEHLVIGGHHDTVYDAPGGNDNTTSIIVTLETARVLSQLQQEIGVGPGRSIRFVTFSAEEQQLQGASAYVEQHYGPETPPRLVINLDELATGHMKGIVLAFPHLHHLVQRQLDTMQDGLVCHVMAQLDTSSDHFPFLRAGLDAAHLWRWRFHSRHPDADFHHEPGDTLDKVNIRELKEYIGQLARLLLRLSHVPPEEWPDNPVTIADVERRLEAERGQVIRVF